MCLWRNRKVIRTSLLLCFPDRLRIVVWLWFSQKLRSTYICRFCGAPKSILIPTYDLRQSCYPPNFLNLRWVLLMVCGRRNRNSWTYSHLTVIVHITSARSPRSCHLHSSAPIASSNETARQPCSFLSRSGKGAGRLSWRLLFWLFFKRIFFRHMSLPSPFSKLYWTKAQRKLRAEHVCRAFAFSQLIYTLFLPHSTLSNDFI